MKVVRKLASVFVLVTLAVGGTGCGIVRLDRGAQDASLGGTPATVTAKPVPAEPGMIAVRYSGGPMGFETDHIIYPDGLVLFGSKSRVSRPAASPILGQIPGKQVRELVGTARAYGFYEWASTYAAPKLQGEEDVKPYRQTLDIWTEPDGRGGFKRHHEVTLAPEATRPAPADLIRLFAQLRGVAVQAKRSLFPVSTAKAILAAKDLARRARSEYSAQAWDQGPCLVDEVIPGWAVDIVHDPRQAVDGKPQNQCLAYRQGKVQHFVEVSTVGDFVRAE